MADDIGAQVRAVPGLPEVIADLLGDGLARIYAEWEGLT